MADTCKADPYAVVRGTAFKRSACLNNLNEKDHERTGEQMSVNPHQLTKMTTRVRNLFVATLVLGCAFDTITDAGAQSITTPTTPNAITPPAETLHF